MRYELEEPVLWRRNRDMAITVRADVKDGEQGVSVTQEIRPLLKDIEAKLPSGYRIDVGGAVEESDKANEALLAVAPVMLVTILLLLMLQLQSFSRMCDGVPDRAARPDRRGAGAAGVPGAARLRRDPRRHRAGRHDHAQLGDPDRPGADRDRARAAIRGTPCVDAAVHRTRPVVLTAAATVLAMIPLTRSVFWGPMAIAIMGGLTVATVLTIFFVPALYAAWFKVRRAAGRRHRPGCRALWCSLPDVPHGSSLIHDRGVLIGSSSPCWKTCSTTGAAASWPPTPSSR